MNGRKLNIVFFLLVSAFKRLNFLKLFSLSLNKLKKTNENSKKEKNTYF